MSKGKKQDETAGKTGQNAKAARQEQLESPRLLLRRPRAADADAIFKRYAADAEVTRYLGWKKHGSVDDTRAFLASSDAEWEKWPSGPMLVFAREGGELLGSTGLAFENPLRASTGFVFAKDSWGKGFATEALSEMVKLSRSLGVRRLYALCHPGHQASAKVLERCGFEREGLLRRHLSFPNLESGGLGDVFCYATLL
ncbi:MAG TPA: GNAT family N-acetyltransferase [Planctomycetota bacterium]